MSRFFTSAALVMFSTLSALPPFATAAPTTLLFQARIDSLWGYWGLTADQPELPLDLQVGDQITGSMVFDPTIPFNVDSEWTRQWEIAVSVGGFDLTTDHFSAYVIDDRRDEGNVVCDCAYAGPVAPDPITFLSDSYANPSAPPLDDRVQITSYFDRFNLQSAELPGFPEWHWQPAFDLSGPLNVLSRDNYLPADATTWNAFTQKQFLFGIVRHGYQDAAAASATIISIALTPEPTSALLAMTAIVGMFGMRKNLAVAKMSPSACHVRAGHAVGNDSQEGLCQSVSISIPKFKFIRKCTRHVSPV